MSDRSMITDSLRPVSGSGGFTFLEVMVALAIMAGVVVTIITSLNLHLDYTLDSKEAIRATIEARSRYEESVATDELDLARSNEADHKGAKEAGSEIEERAGLKWSRKSAGSEFVGVRRVTSTVTPAGAVAVSLSTYEAD